MIEVVTYANKSAGMFDELINNEYGVPIKVLGWGTTWRDFKDKYKAMLNYMNYKSDNAIIVFIDGFDSKINNSLADLDTIFKSHDCKVLFSKEPWDLYDKFNIEKCDSNISANTGMYMGYVKELKIVLYDALNQNCNEDQISLNSICKRYDFIKVDSHERIFRNIPYNKKDTVQEKNAIFVSYPGKMSLYKIPIYAQYIFVYLFTIQLFFLAWLSNKKYILSFMILTTLYYLLYCDRSCV